jgi:glycosyltransferase involved in cell wall biosynthesis
LRREGGGVGSARVQASVRVIWATTALPHPAGAGATAHEFELVRALAEDHDVHVVSTDVANELGTEAVLATGARFTKVEFLRREHPTSRLGVARAMVRADPSLVVWLERDQVPRLAEAIERIAAEEGPPDLVQVTRGELAELVGHVRFPTGLLLFDAVTRALANRRAIEPLARRRLQLQVEMRRMLRYERRWYPQANGWAAVSPVDAQWLRRELGLDVEVIENPIADAFFEPAQGERSPSRVTFVGALTHGPNVDAISWLVDEIWPMVRRRRPDAELVVVGRGDHAGLAEARVRPMVESVGGRLDANVEDIMPYYWETAVVAAPLREGTGLRNKVLHAMATGTPTVATPNALEGVPGAEHAWSASTAAEVADAIVAVLDDPAAAARRAAAAVDALRELRTERIAERHAQWWKSLVA